MTSNVCLCCLIILVLCFLSLLEASNQTSYSTIFPVDATGCQASKTESNGTKLRKSARTNSTNDVLLICEKVQYQPNVTFMTYMMRLRLCDFAEDKGVFKHECLAAPHKDQSDYHSLAYLKFCNENAYNDVCHRTLPVNHEFTPENVVSWWLQYNNVSYVKNKVSSSKSNYKKLPETRISENYCSQINSFFETLLQEYDFLTSDNVRENTNGIRSSDFIQPFANPHYKVLRVRAPFYCKDTVCGFSVSNDSIHPATKFGCFSSSCQSSLFANLIMYAVLATAIIVANSLVILVAKRTNLFRDIQGYFKIHLAVADFMVGAFVIPGIICQHYLDYWRPLPLTYNGDDSPTIAGSLQYPREYFNAIGVISFSSMAISILTLCTASCDRFFAITKPFRYRQGKYFTKKRMIAAQFVNWILGLACALIPLLAPHQYTYHPSGIFLGGDEFCLIMVGSLLGAALFAAWIINAMTLCHVKKHFEARRSIVAAPSRTPSTSSTLLSLSFRKEVKTFGGGGGSFTVRRE